MDVRIEGTGLLARLWLDGVDITESVVGYELEHEAGEYPVLLLKMRVEGMSVDEALVEVVEEEG